MSADRACAGCLGRTWLIARLAGSIEIARHHKRRLREILALSEEKLIAGLGGVRAASIADEFERLDIDQLREAVDRSGLEAACRHDPAYPARLRDLEDAPAALFVAGGITRLEALAGADLERGPRAAAVVGTRRASADGLEVARALGRGLAAAGVTLVSGMALGVDSAAHAGALESSGRTVAVLAGGADVPYPPSKARLHQLIGERGCVVGELPPGFAALRWCFPARNRIAHPRSHRPSRYLSHPQRPSQSKSSRLPAHSGTTAVPRPTRTTEMPSAPHDFQFVGIDGKVHKPSDPDYWQHKARDLQDTVRELQSAIVDLQHRVAALDGGEVHWPGDSYEPPHDLPRRQSRDW